MAPFNFRTTKSIDRHRSHILGKLGPNFIVLRNVSFFLKRDKPLSPRLCKCKRSALSENESGFDFLEAKERSSGVSRWFHHPSIGSGLSIALSKIPRLLAVSGRCETQKPRHLSGIQLISAVLGD